ncbi:hypothetical protein [Helicobacter cetorum]|uniref:Uncharacterized protein n=1 Tax=Helicobacter cetorum (strain ATCC BAA-540 / CCUG 52418 / MIT 99-5656) TaxID=1163745 RepID=I0ERE2_HELCM|nr:hypothetical protein [Helicobacter cetorum]AFI05511.1 hypothetical protein HCD_02455 [Helicobacter cetorum MIT 99-5656]
MRLVRFNAPKGELKGFDKYHTEIFKQVLSGDSIELNLTKTNYYTYNGVKFCVCDGLGELDFRDYPNNVDFSLLKLRVLSDFLIESIEPTKESEKTLLNEFLRIYDLNISKGVYYLDPPYFKELEKELCLC